MTLTKLKYFLALAECKNITRTAAKLYMAQSNLSKQISLFEQEVGTQLFIRHAHGVELTLAGEMVYDKLRHIPALIETTFEHARTIDDYQNFRIGILEGFDFTRERFRALQNAYPDYRFTFERRSYENLFQRLQEGKYDAIITMGWYKDQLPAANLRSARIRPLDLGALISIDHPLAEQDRISELRDIPIVSLDPNASPAYYRMIQNVCRLNQISPGAYFYVEDFEDLLLNIETRMTMGIMASNNGIRAKSEIKTIPLQGGDSYFEIVCWDESNRNPVVKSLVEIMKER